MQLTELKRLPKDLDHKLAAVSPNNHHLALEREKSLEIYDLNQLDA